MKAHIEKIYSKSINIMASNVQVVQQSIEKMCLSIDAIHIGDDKRLLVFLTQVCVMFIALSLSPEKLNDAFHREEFCQLFCKLTASLASTRITITRL